jgi:dienelactone hydrolase
VLTRTVRRLAGLPLFLQAAVAARATVRGTAPTPDRAGVGSAVLDLVDTSRRTEPREGEPLDQRRLPTTVWYPEAAGGPLPLVVFSHGLGSAPEAYADLLASWAAAGLVVAAPLFPLTSGRAPAPPRRRDILNQPADVTFVLTRLLEAAADPASPLAGRVDGDRIAAAGHSAGAITTLGLRSTLLADPRIRAVVLLAGADPGLGIEFADPPTPLLVVQGRADRSIRAAAARETYAVAPAPKALVELRLGLHSEPFADPRDVHFPVVAEVTTTFLRWALASQPHALTELRRAARGSRWAVLQDDRLGPG